MSQVHLKPAALKFDVASALSQGKRATQEDAIVVDFPVGANVGLMVLSDGMGGHNAGDVASNIVVTEVFRELKRRTPELRADPDCAGRALRQAAEAANRAIGTHARENPKTEGMGATLIGLVQQADTLSWISVGDSVLFLYRNDRLYQLNQNHSLAPQIDYLARQGLLSEEAARSHPDRHCLTSALLGDEIPFIDCPETPLRLREGDVVLAASDGLPILENAQVEAVLATHGGGNASDLVEALLRQVEAINNPDQDNVSVTVLRAVSAAPKRERIQSVPQGGLYERLREFGPGWFGVKRNPKLGGVIEALQGLVARRALPTRAAATAETLIKRLTSPVRLAVMGPPESGKSKLVNVLCGAELVPSDVHLPTTDIRYGEAPRLRVTLADGRHKDLPDLDVRAAAAEEPSLVEIRAPLEMLRRISLLELVTDGSPRELKAASNWAARRAEMALWVTPDFSEAEQAIWNAMPKSLRSNAFLVTSRLDQQTLERQELIRRMSDAARNGEFLGVYPVTALQVAEALAAGVDDIAHFMEASGCAGLMEALLARLDQGEQADIDAAEYFLLRFGEAPPEDTADGPAAESHSPSSGAFRGRKRGARPRLRRAMMPTSRNLSDLLRRPSGECDPAIPRPACAGPGRGAAGAPPGHAPKENREPGPNRLLSSEAAGTESTAASAPAATLDKALAALRSGATGMLEGLDHGEVPAAGILDECANTIEALSELTFGTPFLDNSVAEAADVVLLLQVERSEMAAEDAVCALLQLKRDFETADAA